MAEANLKDLTSAVYKIAENSPKIQKDVKDIRDAVIGTGGILEAINVIAEKLDLSKKKGRIEKLVNKPTLRQDKTLIKNTNSMTDILNKILIQVSKINARPRLKNENISTGRKSRLNADNFKREPDRKDKGKGLESFYKSIDIIDKLKGIKLKDFIFAKTKMKHISNMMIKFKDMFKSFKNEKEMEATVKFANSSIEIVKKLSKVAIFAIPAKLGLNVIEKLFLGSKRKPGGLLAVFREVDNNKKIIKSGDKSMKEILAATGAMFLTSILLSGLAVTGVPAMLGALAMKGIVWIMKGTFEILNKAKKNALQGSLVLLIMSSSLITFALGLGLMVNAVKGMKWKDFGMMMASIAAISAVFAVIGIPAVTALIGLGSIAVLAMGASLLLFSIGLAKTINALKGTDWDEFNEMSKSIWKLGLEISKVGALSIPIGLGSSALILMGGSLFLFGGAIKSWMKLSNIQPALDNIKNAVKSVKDVVKDRFDMKSVRQLRKVGRTLKVLYKGIKDWDKFDGLKAAKNIGITIEKLNEVFKKQIDKKNVNTYSSVGRVLRRLYKGIKDWESINSEKALKNIDVAITKLKDVFNDKIDKKSVRSFSSTGRVLRRLYKGLKFWENINSQKATTNVAYAVTILKRTFSGNVDKNQVKTMDTLVKVTNMSSGIIDSLKAWDSYKPGDALSKIETTVNELLNIFGMSELKKTQLEDNVKDAVAKKKGFLANITEGVVNVVKTTVDNMNNNATNRGVKKTMASLEEVMNSLFSVKTFLTPWLNFDSTAGITNIQYSIKGILSQIMYTAEVEKLYGGSVQNPVLGKYFMRTSTHLMSGMNNLSKGLSGLSNFSNLEIPFKNTIKSINKLDVSKASVMLNLFKSFSRIGIKPFDRFTKAVYKFSDSCNDLIEALDSFEPISNNTVTTNENGETTISSGSVSITNSQDLAKAIAEAIKSLPINVQTDISDVRLVVNNETGRRIILSLDN